MDRRNFIKSLFATAVAASLPKLSAETQTVLVDRIMRAIKVDYHPGAKVLSAYFTPGRMSNAELMAMTSVDPKLETTVEDIGGDLYRVKVKRTAPNDDGISLSVSTGDSDGLFIGGMKEIESYLSKYPDRIACNVVSFGGGVDVNFIVKA